jgi:hypothetical protein
MSTLAYLLMSIWVVMKSVYTLGRTRLVYILFWHFKLLNFCLATDLVDKRANCSWTRVDSQSHQDSSWNYPTYYASPLWRYWCVFNAYSSWPQVAEIWTDDRVRAISLAMGMIPILWTTSPGHKFDTNDWRVAGGSINGSTSFDTFQSILKDASTLDSGWVLFSGWSSSSHKLPSFIVLQHDLFEITVDLAVGYTLDAALSHDPKFAVRFYQVLVCINCPHTLFHSLVASCWSMHEITNDQSVHGKQQEFILPKSR